jgi:hypothetical protein
MTQQQKTLITITGVLGKQGRSAAQTLLASGQYRVRGIPDGFIHRRQKI